jgi:hypothetical protein
VKRGRGEEGEMKKKVSGTPRFGAPAFFMVTKSVMS